MKMRATFPVFRYHNRRLEDNLINQGIAEEYLVSKDKNNRDLLAILPTNRVRNEKEHYTVCDGSIDRRKCTACLACQIGLATPDDGVDEVGIPSSQPCYSYRHLADFIFKGNYVALPSRSNIASPILKRFNEYTGDWDERNFTNPLIGCYLWAISGGKAIVSCSPNHELSLDVSLLTGEREGHLDVTLRTFYEGKKYLLVGEGKRNVNSFLNDSSREQQKKYENRIEQIGKKFGYVSLFSYIIGGNEEPMYPATVSNVPMFIYRNNFFNDIHRNGKRFVSLHALRGLGVLFISSKGKLCLENILFPLFRNENVYGLVLGGPIVRHNKEFVLDSLDNFISIH
jgi:hypothetical protein